MSGASAGDAVYLDTSAIVSLYVLERHSERIRRVTLEASEAITSRIAYAEARAAFARMRRGGTLPRRAYAAIVEGFNRDWTALGHIEVTEPAVRAAADLVEQYPLRGLDALHLASAIRVRADAARVTFCCHDARLAAAARAEGFEVVP